MIPQQTTACLTTSPTQASQTKRMHHPRRPARAATAASTLVIIGLALTGVLCTGRKGWERGRGAARHRQKKEGRQIGFPRASSCPLSATTHTAAPPPSPSLAQAAVAVYKLTGPGATPPAPWKAALLEGLVWRALAATPGVVASVDVLPPTSDSDDPTSTLASVRVRGVGGSDALTALWSFLGTNATAALNDGVASLGLPGWDVRASLVSVNAQEVGSVAGGPSKGQKGGAPPLAVPAEARRAPSGGGGGAPTPSPTAADAPAVPTPAQQQKAAPAPASPATTQPPPPPATTTQPPPLPPPRPRRSPRRCRRLPPPSPRRSGTLPRLRPPHLRLRPPPCRSRRRRHPPRHHPPLPTPPPRLPPPRPAPPSLRHPGRPQPRAQPCRSLSRCAWRGRRGHRSAPLPRARRCRRRLARRPQRWDWRWMTPKCWMCR